MKHEIETYFLKQKKWKKELLLLRKIVLDCGLDETYKWKHPCYVSKGKNIVILHEFKEYCAISFFKGVLINDVDKKLIQPTENTHSARQLRFTLLSDVVDLELTIKNYVVQAVKNEHLELKVTPKKNTAHQVPQELEQVFNEHPTFKTAFYKLTLGRQKGYLLHFSKAKQSKTRTARIYKSMQKIIDGYGMTDCTCGLTKRKPNCDGSHKQLNPKELSN